MKRKNELLYWEQQNNINPFAIGLERYFDKITLILYHREIKNGYMQLTRLYFDSPLKIVETVKKLVTMYEKLGKNISMSGKDIADLYLQVEKVF